MDRSKYSLDETGIRKHEKIWNFMFVVRTKANFKNMNIYYNYETDSGTETAIGCLFVIIIF